MIDAVRQTTAEDWDARADALDTGDPLAHARALFDLPEGVVYLDGNSLGPLPKTVPARLAQTVEQEWRTDLIRSWNTAGWIDLPAKIGAKIGALIGAEPETVVAADSTSTNLFKVLSGALALRPDRRKIISERQNFPTDLYMAEGVIGQLGQGHELVLIDSPDELAGLVDDQTAVVMLTHVNYRSGTMFDMADVTALAHRAGALTVWDLAHSAGAVPVDLAGAKADFAIGCGYKFLNGGPGAPAFLYVAPTHQQSFSQPLSGWMGHAAPFAFEPSYRPADGVSRALCGTPPVLAMAALDAAMDIWQQVSMEEVRAKSVEQCAFFIEAVESHCPGHGLRLLTPRDPAQRGSQVSFAAPEGGFAMMKCLISHNVIGDFRAPDILRFGITPLYTKYADLLAAARCLADILDSGEWDDPAFHKRGKVT